MKAAILRGKNDLVIGDVLDPPNIVPEGFVKVAVKAVGICGSDVHYYQHGAIGDFVLQEPMILGHEIGGIVETVGAGVQFNIGEVVALEPGIPCRQCTQCRSGQYNLCESIRFFATPPVDGAMTSYVIHPADFTFRTNGLTVEEACLAEPMSVGIYATRQASIHLGQEVFVMGAGPVGLMTAMACLAEGANVRIFDVQEERVRMARELGMVAEVFNSGRKIRSDVVIDCTGNESAIAWGQHSVKAGGKLILVGMGTKDGMKLDGLDLTLRGISVRGIFRYANTFPAAIQLIHKYRDKMKLFLSNKIPFEAVPKYFLDGNFNSHIKTIVSL
ncbi:NAD(P)-dependent alcohol dehydrogenase [Alicyclobacillus sp. SP_1]|uniref:NAD(P)-dependent alcohol dehydrogenase n=1 Tax=Alicyclobacillus sp. SP_1 TaxID=2942475 RepID=UPI0021580360|nr:NAD(P)-dependent alcohol dehydrogenase [Alicyclobacillus sp. SP_1]